MKIRVATTLLAALVLLVLAAAPVAVADHHEKGEKGEKAEKAEHHEHHEHHEDHEHHEHHGDHEHHEHREHMAAADNPAAGPMLRDFDRASQKIISLAEAFPAGTYDWRPAEGVRSVSETFMHVAQANFFLAAALGADLPEDMPEDMEAITDKESVVKWLERSLQHAEKGLEMAGGTDMTAEKELFGQTMTVGDAAFILLTHNHEHLGQAIAYARSNGVVPPWSQQPQGDES